MIIRTETERETYIEAGKRLANVLEALAKASVAGVSTEALDDLAERMIRDYGDEPVFLGYRPEGASRPYPATLCVSVNDEVVHGIPNEIPRILRNGDIVSLDLGLSHTGFIVDAARTVAVGTVSPRIAKLLSVTETALADGIAEAHIGNYIGDISHAIQKTVERSGFSIVKELGGHGVGHTLHEDPFIANYGRAGKGVELVEGMVLAIEPIVSAGKRSVLLAKDGWMFRTRDGSPSAHFEHTILIEADGALVLTER